MEVEGLMHWEIRLKGRLMRLKTLSGKLQLRLFRI